MSLLWNRIKYFSYRALNKEELSTYHKLNVILGQSLDKSGERIKREFNGSQHFFPANQSPDKHPVFDKMVNELEKQKKILNQEMHDALKDILIPDLVNICSEYAGLKK